MEKSIRAREQRLKRWHRLGQLMHTDTKANEGNRLFLDKVGIDKNCPRGCECKLELHTAMGASGALREREFCPLCRYSSSWRTVEIAERT